MNIRIAALLACLCAAPQVAQPACTVSATNLSFGQYVTSSGSAADTTGNIAVTCSGLANLLVGYTIALSTGASGSYAPRTLTSGANTLNYNLYTDLLRTTVWGNGSGSSTVSGSILVQLLFPTTNNHTVYGRIPASQNVAPGNYSDTITVTVNY
jgi:spore coat protein U-like protein